MDDLSHPVAEAPLDVERLRQDFPILSRSVHATRGKPGKPLVYLDSAASAQKPRAVIEAMTRFMEEEYANVHRGVHFLSQRATDAFEEARRTVARFLNAPTDQSIVFTRNATEAFNLVAGSYGRAFLERGDEVVLSIMEHHANIVPWQLLQAERGIVIKVVPVDDDGVLDMAAYEALLSERTRFVSITHCSNVLGTVTPAKEIARLAHARGIPVAFDGSQAVVHGVVDVQDIDADFYVFTGHKLYGPTGIGVLYGKPELLRRMPPYQGGGEMILSVSFEGTTFKEPPMRFEAGTPPITEAVGLGAAIDYVEAVGREAIAAHEQDLLRYATQQLGRVEGLRILGTAPAKGPLVSFTVRGVHPHDLGSIVDHHGVAVRVGRHCAEPLMERFGESASVRASFAVYNTRQEADALVEAVVAVKEFFGE